MVVVTRSTGVRCEGAQWQSGAGRTHEGVMVHMGARGEVYTSIFFVQKIELARAGVFGAKSSFSGAIGLDALHGVDIWPLNNGKNY